MLLCLLKAVITFEDAHTPQTPTAYTNAQIVCRVSGNPNPTVYWRYRGQRLITGVFHFYFCNPPSLSLICLLRLLFCYNFISWYSGLFEQENPV